VAFVVDGLEKPTDVGIEHPVHLPRQEPGVQRIQRMSSSPIMDLTGYRQSETTEPSATATAFDMLHLP